MPVLAEDPRFAATDLVIHEFDSWSFGPGTILACPCICWFSEPELGSESVE